MHLGQGGGLVEGFLVVVVAEFVVDGFADRILVRVVDVFEQVLEASNEKWHGQHLLGVRVHRLQNRSEIHMTFFFCSYCFNIRLRLFFRTEKKFVDGKVCKMGESDDEDADQSDADYCQVSVLRIGPVKLPGEVVVEQAGKDCLLDAVMHEGNVVRVLEDPKEVGQTGGAAEVVDLRERDGHVEDQEDPPGHSVVQGWIRVRKGPGECEGHGADDDAEDQSEKGQNIFQR